MKLRTLKRRMANALTAPTCGRVISWLLHDRIPTHGCTIDTSSPHISPDTKAQLFLGTYERTEIRFALRYLRSDLDIVELGSSVGMIGSLLARRLRPPCRIICLEAHPGLVPVVVGNVSRNAPTAQFIVLNRAIDYETNSGCSDLMPSPWSHSGKLGHGEGTIRVTSATLSDILCEQGIDEYILVSDIEGAEAGLLLEDPDALRKCRQMVIELHTTNFRGKRVTSEEMARMLVEKHGFTLLESYGVVYAFARRAASLENSAHLPRVAENA